MCHSFRIGVLLLVLTVSGLAGCLAPHPEEAAQVLPFGAVGGDTEAVTVTDDGLARIVTTRTFEGRFEADDRVPHLVQTSMDESAELRFPVIETPRIGVPVTIELMLRYERGEPEIGVADDPLVLALDVAIPPFVPHEPEVDGGEVRLTVPLAPHAPVDAIVRHVVPDMARNEPVAFTLDATVTWHLDAVPAGIPVAVDIDPASEMPVLQPLSKRLSYALFGPDGDFVGVFPLEGALPSGLQAGEHVLAVLKAPFEADAGAPLLRIHGPAGVTARALEWQQDTLASIPLGPDGTAQGAFDVPRPLWGISLEVSGTHTWADGYAWSIERAGQVVVEGGCAPCSGFAPYGLLGVTTAQHTELVPGAHTLGMDGMFGDADLVVVGHMPDRA